MPLQRLLRALAGLSIALGGSGRVPAADWLQTGYDSAHSGFNPLETQLGPGNAASLSKIASWTLPDFVYGSGVLLENVATAQGYRNVLYTTSQGGMVFAIDASSGAMLWSKTTGTVGWSVHPTPAIDPNREFVYSYGADGKVHKFSAGSGDETIDSAWPELVTTKPDVEHGASGLTIGVTGAGTRYLYAVTTGYFGDGGDYQGHLTTIDLDTGTQTVFNALCSDVAVHSSREAATASTTAPVAAQVFGVDQALPSTRRQGMFTSQPGTVTTMPCWAALTGATAFLRWRPMASHSSEILWIATHRRTINSWTMMIATWARDHSRLSETWPVTRMAAWG
jgi:hypothetical protein